MYNIVNQGIAARIRRERQEGIMKKNVALRTARDTIVNPAGMAQIELLRITSGLIRTAASRDAAESKAIRKELSVMEASRLHIRKAEKGFRFAAYPEEPSARQRAGKDTREIGISQDQARVHMLARRAYLLQRLSMIENNQRRLQKILSSCDSARSELRLQKDLKRYCEAGLDLSRILFTKEQNEWIDRPYSPNPYYKESLKQNTKHGVPVRSLSEATLGSFLESVGLPFRTDDLVEIHSEYGVQPFRENYFADFKVPNLCGGITIHEHLGALHLQDYPDNSLKRLNDYHNHVVYELPGRQVKHSEFTWSFEYDLVDTGSMEALLRRMLLPDLYE